MNAYETSQLGVDFIKDKEGFRAEVYNDVAGKPTIGYGHLLIPGEHLFNITQDKAEAILKSDLFKAEKAVCDLVKFPITQTEFDALVSFTFNLGRRALQNSTLLKYLNNGDVSKAADEFPKWNHAGGVVVAGLTARRLQEQAMFLFGRP